MTGDQRNSYAKLTGLMTSSLEPKLPPKRNAYSTFIDLSAANIATGQALLTTAPPYAPAPPLPNIQVHATSIGGVLTVTLVANAAYPYPVAIKAARPMYAANDVYKSTAFKKIGSVPSLGLMTNITAQYQSRYRVPGTGYKIALELMGVAPGGYHTASLLLTGIVGATAAEGMPHDTDDTPQGAPVTLKVG